MKFISSLICFVLSEFFCTVKSDDYLGSDAYIGCFKDNRLARDLNKLPGQLGNVWIGANSNMTIGACLNLCRGFSLPYAGLEFSNECYCGDSYGRYGKTPDTECNFRCSGNITEICGGIDRISVYSVKTLTRSELVIVFQTVFNRNMTPIRLAQTSSSWIQLTRETNKIEIFLNNNYLVPYVKLNAIRPDLAFNQNYIFISLRGNQLATFYNCYITDAIMLNDTTLSNSFLSSNLSQLYGTVIFNRNLNDVFGMYGCVNYNDAYQQIFSQTNNLVKGYCKLTLNDIHNVNNQITQLIQSISNNRTVISNYLNLIENSLKYCSKKKC